MSPSPNSARLAAAPRRRPRLWLLGILLAMISAATGSALGPASAWAHAQLLTSVPSNGQVLPTSPRVLQLQFDERVGLVFGAVRLLDPDGGIVKTASPTHPDRDETTVTVALERDLAPGYYTVSWRVVSADGHPVQGAFAFTVGAGGAKRSGSADLSTVDRHDSTVDVVSSTTRWIGFLGLALLIGGCFFVALAWPGGAGVRRVRRIVWTGWGTVLTTTVLAALLYGPYAAGYPLGWAIDPPLLWQTLHTQPGVALAIRALLLGLLAPVLVVFLRKAGTASSRARWAGAAGVIGVGIVLAATWSVTTHSAVGGDAVLALPSDVAHLVAMAVWIGGLAVLVAGLLPLRDVRAMRVAMPMFSRTALICVAVLVATGTYAAWRQVRSAPALVHTSYGQVLIVKLGMVALIVVLGAGAREWVRRHYTVAKAPPGRRPRGPNDPDPFQVYRFRRRIAVEAGLGVAVLGLTAVLVSTEPARVTYAAQLAPNAPSTAAHPLPGQLAAIQGQPQSAVPFETPSGKGFVSIEVQPARVGHSVLHLAVFGATGQLLNVPEVRVSMSLPGQDVGPLPVHLDGAGGHYAGVVPLPLPGAWEIAVTIRTSDLDQQIVRIPLQVQR